MRATALAIALTVSFATLFVPTAAAHIDHCTRGVCIYEWEWSWGDGSCYEGEPHWWSWRIVRVSFLAEGVEHEVELQTSCDSHVWSEGDRYESSRVHAAYTTEDQESGNASWLWVDWYGTETEDGSTCTLRVWSYRQETLPEGTMHEECPARPPFVQSA